jgi:hypothetical protein
MSQAVVRQLNLEVIYQRYFNAIWICLPAVADVNSPGLVASNVRLSPRKFGWFGRLNASNRNCSWWPSFGRAKFFIVEKSHENASGPRIEGYNISGGRPVFINTYRSERAR